jgi:crotonobetainyl-CoA:carnitine CoA-transferase CaiB-like acyl-CoA transferase
MRVVELSATSAGAYAGLLLAELGHDVVRVRGPGIGADGGSDRAGDDALAASRAAFLDRGRRELGLDVAARPELLVQLAAAADVVIEDLGSGGLERLGIGPRALRATPLVRLSPFGQQGPAADWLATDLVVQAMGGVLHSTGYDGEPPQKLPGDTAAMLTGIQGATAALAAVLGVEAGSDAARTIDVAAQHSLLQHWSRHVQQYAYSGLLMRREARVANGVTFPHTVLAADGWLYLLALRAPLDAMARFLGIGHLFDDAMADPAERMRRWPQVEPHFREALRARGRYEWFAAAAEVGWTFAPIEDAQQVLHGPQSVARGFVGQVRDGGAAQGAGGGWPCPRLPFTGGPRPVQANAADEPVAAAILREWLSLTDEAIATLCAAGAVT